MSSLPAFERTCAPSRAGGPTLRALRGRRGLVRVVLWGFVWGCLVGPGLHLVDHSDDHVHGPGGAIERVRAAAHHHHEHVAAHHHERVTAHHHGHMAAPPMDRSVLTAQRAAHGRGDAWHFGRALLDAAAPPTPESPGAGPVLGLPTAPRIPRLSPRRSPAHPRGPPSGARRPLV